jgi:hypothetical protein
VIAASKQAGGILGMVVAMAIVNESVSIVVDAITTRRFTFVSPFVELQVWMCFIDSGVQHLDDN